MQRRNMSLDEDVARILDDVAGGQSSASAYVCDVVRDAERRWRAALALLVAAGWGTRELLAACDVLNGWGLIQQPPAWAAMSMQDAAADGICAKWEVDERRWAELAAQVRGNADEAQALVDLAAEFWRMNPRVERAIERLLVLVDEGAHHGG